jgi:hypothetical protein
MAKQSQSQAGKSAGRSSASINGIDGNTFPAENITPLTPPAKSSTKVQAKTQNQGLEKVGQVIGMPDEVEGMDDEEVGGLGDIDEIEGGGVALSEEKEIDSMILEAIKAMANLHSFLESEDFIGAKSAIESIEGKWPIIVAAIEDKFGMEFPGSSEAQNA